MRPKKNSPLADKIMLIISALMLLWFINDAKGYEGLADKVAKPKPYTQEC